MLKTYFLIRLDDACPTMDHRRWSWIEDLLDKYGIKPLVGVIPHNEDPKQIIDAEDGSFWGLVSKWENKGWSIALHGYNHVYSSNQGGLNPLWKKSEFAGNPIDLQREKIRRGVTIMEEKGISPKYFFAPSHTFDENTLKALKEESDIRIISDTIARKPYMQYGFTFLPQQSGHPITLPFGGFVTICYHPSVMTDEQFRRFEHFLITSKDNIISFSDLDLDNLKGKSLIDRILSSYYFIRRKLR